MIYDAQRGRRQWLQLVEEQHLSGISAIEFCRRRGIRHSSFYCARRRLRARGELTPAETGGETPAGRDEVRRDVCVQAVHFVEARVQEIAAQPQDLAKAPQTRADAAGVLKLRLGRGRSVVLRRGFDRQLLREILALLEPSGSQVMGGKEGLS